MTMTDSQYHALVDDIFSKIETAIEQAIDEQDADIDIDASGNVLQLEFADASKIVINKQEPLHEIWVATRFGGYHFGYIDNQWVDDRNQLVFIPFIIDSISRQGNINISLNN